MQQSGLRGKEYEQVISALLARTLAVYSQQ